MTAETLVAGRYRIGPCLGMGGMGRVWLARDEVLRRDVAIKEIALPFGLTDEEREEMRERTLREARAAARLSHPNVVRTYDVQHGDERPWIVMEYVPSRSLLQVIKENGPLAVDQVAGIGLAVLSALDAACRVGVMHRDVKPSNVLIADDGRVLLTDFGSAIIDEGGEGALTRTGVILGSPRYISPERAHNGTSTLESDLWSLGATLYEAVEGRAPYTRETTMATLVALATEKPDPVQKAGPLKPVLHGLLQKNPKARMRIPEVEERLRRIADVQNAVKLRNVPAPRTPERSGQLLAFPTAAEVLAERQRITAGALPGGADERPAVPVVAESAPLPAWSSAGTRDLLAHRPRWRLVAAGVAAAVAIVTGATAYAINGNNLPWSKAEQAAAGQGGALDAVVPDGASPSPSAATRNAVTVLPAGYKWYASKSGFRLGWPAKWVKVGETRTSVVLCFPGGPPAVSVREWNRSDPDIAVALAREETAAALPGYQRLGMDVAQADGATWEYTFTDPKMGALHGIERSVVAGGRSYLIQWRAPATKWDEFRPMFDVVLGTFQPAPPLAQAAAGQDAIPAAFFWYRSPSGFRFAAPKKWTVVGKPTDSRITYCAPGGPPVVDVRAWTPTSGDLRVAMEEEERVAKLPRYQRISLDVLPGNSGAALEYTFTDPQMGRLHGLDRVFVTRTGVYIVQFRTPAAKWSANLGTLGVIANSFRA